MNAAPKGSTSKRGYLGKFPEKVICNVFYALNFNGLFVECKFTGFPGKKPTLPICASTNSWTGKNAKRSVLLRSLNVFRLGFLGCFEGESALNIQSATSSSKYASSSLPA